MATTADRDIPATDFAPRCGDTLVHSYKLLITSMACLAFGCATINPRMPGIPPTSAPSQLPQTSTVRINVQASIAPVAPALDAAIPMRYDTNPYCMIFPVIACAKGSVDREPVRFTFTTDRLSLRAGINYETDVFVGGLYGSCGKPDNTKRRATIGIDAQLVWDSSYTLRLANGQAKVTGVDPCKITDANVDITGAVMDAMNRVVKDLPDQANQQLQATSIIRDAAAKVWERVQTPVALDPQFWLEIKPFGIIASAPQGRNEAFSASVAAFASIRVILGQPPNPGPTPTPLPPLQGEGVTPQDFHVTPRLTLPFKEVNALLAKALVGKVLQLNPNLPLPYVKIEQTYFRGSGQYFVIGIDMSGSVRGIAWFTGKVTYDAGQRILLIQYVDIDPETQKAIAQVAEWLSPRLSDTIRQAADGYRFDVGARVDDLQRKIQSAMNRPLGSDAVLSTQLNPLTITGPFTDDNNFLFDMDLTGRAEVTFSPSGQPLPTGREIRLVSVAFITSGDDKDAEEPVTLSLEYRGATIASRQVGVAERWGDDPPETQGPYYLRVPASLNITNCHDLTLHIRKEPNGSPTGHGWKNSMTAQLLRSDGSALPAGHSNFDQWGDGESHPYDRSFTLCESGVD